MTRLRRELVGAFALVVACCGAYSGGCSSAKQERTQIVVVVTSDLAVPAELDEIRVHARFVGASPSETAKGTLQAADDLPVSAAFEPSGKKLGPMDITVGGYRDDTKVVEQVRRLSFARDRTVELEVMLSQACATATAPDCDADQTCIAGECGDRSVDVSTLPDYHATSTSSADGGPGPGDGGGASGESGGGRGGASGRSGSGGSGGRGGSGGNAGNAGSGGSGGAGVSDGGVDPDGGQDAGQCEATAETCNEDDDDCDGKVDEGFDLDSLAHCGACNSPCPQDLPFAASVCVDGECQLVCAPGTADCDTMLSTGCEARLAEPATCGDCETMCEDTTPFCAQEGSSASCVGTCGGDTPDECGDSCVDTETDIFHCSGCGEPCAGAPNGTPVCAGGSCGFSCPGALQDCDGMAGNGCETDTQSDVDFCGGCSAGDACPARAHATRRCTGGDCGFTCNPGYGNCDGMTGNGCETDTFENDNHCGACNVACTGSQVCCGTRCGVLNLLGICL